MLSEQEIKLRKLWLKFTEEDDAVLKEEVDHFVDGRVNDELSALVLTLRRTTTAQRDQQAAQRDIHHRMKIKSSTRMSRYSGSPA